MIDVECLAAFVTVAELQSFSRAADRLDTVQSVVSKRLRRLEDRLGTQLLDRRIKTKIKLTRVGEMFLPQAVQALAQNEMTERIGRNLARGNIGPLRIGFVFSAALNGVIAKMLKCLREAFPEMRLQPHLKETPEQLEALEAGNLDIALVRPRPTYPSGCHAYEIHSDPLIICLSATHKLNGTTPLMPHHLAKECFIIPQFHEQVGLIESIQNLARAGNFEMPEIIRTHDFLTAACLAATGDGVVLAPASLAKLDLDDVSYLPLSDYEEQLVTVLVCREDAPAEAIKIIQDFFGISKRST